LLVFNDWALYHSDEMAIVDCVRRGFSEQRPLIDAPGHFFGPTEEALAIGHSHLAVTFGWSAYLYLASGAASVLLWEGDLVDVWSPDESVTQRVLGVVQSYELRVTSGHAAQPDAPPNGGPAMPLGNSGADEGPPSVS
jgi:hypothetical protein